MEQRYVTFTFDDGLVNGARKAAITMDKAGFRATFFLVTSWVGNKPQRKFRDNWNKGRDHGAWEDWRQFQDAGHEIGSHTVSHLNMGGRLARWVPCIAKYEIAYSQKQILQGTGKSPFSISMPWNSWNEDFSKLLLRYYQACRIGGAQGQPNKVTNADWYRLDSWAPRPEHSPEVIAERVKSLGPAEWLILQFHSLDGEGYEPISTEHFKQIVEKISVIDNLQCRTIAEMIKLFKTR